MDDVRTRYTEAAAVEETLANVIVGSDGAKQLNERMIGDIPTEHSLARLLEYKFVDGLTPTPMGRAVARHFLSPAQAFTILEGIRHDTDPYDIVAAVELMDQD
jgi:helicase